MKVQKLKTIFTMSVLAVAIAACASPPPLPDSQWPA